MLEVPNQAYLSIWYKDFPEDRILERFGSFLATVPFSETMPGFTHLAIRAVDPSESPVLEQDMRSMPLDGAEIIEIAKDHLHSDCSYEVQCHWDLWVSDGATGHWKLEPRTLEIFCHGEDYGNALWEQNGHLEVDFGFEHLFTGHAGLLGIRRTARAAPQSPEEDCFLASMSQQSNLQMYQEKTRANILKLFDWVRQIEMALPVERIRLWSEGEENFEARLEEILAVR